MDERRTAQPLRDFWVYVHGPRARDFEAVYGTTCVPVLSPVPGPTILPGFDDPQLVYLLDLTWVDEVGRREQLIDYIAQRFGQNRAAVAQGLDAEGMPILAEQTTLRIDHPHRWLGDDIDEDDDDPDLDRRPPTTTPAGRTDR